MSKVLKELKAEVRGIWREVKDEVSPPSTTEELGRVFEDVVRDIRFYAKELKGDAKKACSLVETGFDDFAKDPKKNIKQFFEDLGDALKDFGTNFPVVAKLVGFVKSAGSLAASIGGSERDRVSAWKDFNQSKADLYNAIKKAVGLEKSDSKGRH